MILSKDIDSDKAAFLIASRNVDKRGYAGHAHATDSYGTALLNEVLIRNNSKADRLPNKRPSTLSATPPTTSLTGAVYPRTTKGHQARGTGNNSTMHPTLVQTRIATQPTHIGAQVSPQHLADRLTTLVADLCQLEPLTEAYANNRHTILEILRRAVILKPIRMHLALNNMYNVIALFASCYTKAWKCVGNCRKRR
jgi:hypothetical protein